MSMRFGFEHDDFSDDDIEQNFQTEQTVSGSEIAPASNTDVTENHTIWRNESSAIHRDAAESDSTTSFQRLLAEYLADGGDSAQREPTSRHGSISARQESTSTQHGSAPGWYSSTSFRPRSAVIEHGSKRSASRGSVSSIQSESRKSTSIQRESIPTRYVSTSAYYESEPAEYESMSAQQHLPSSSTSQRMLTSFEGTTFTLHDWTIPTPHQNSISAKWTICIAHGLGIFGRSDLSFAQHESLQTRAGSQRSDFSNHGQTSIQHASSFARDGSAPAQYESSDDTSRSGRFTSSSTSHGTTASIAHRSTYSAQPGPSVSHRRSTPAQHESHDITSDQHESNTSTQHESSNRQHEVTSTGGQASTTQHSSHKSTTNERGSAAGRNRSTVADEKPTSGQERSSQAAPAQRKQKVSSTSAKNESKASSHQSEQLTGTKNGSAPAQPETSVADDKSATTDQKASQQATSSAQDESATTVQVRHALTSTQDKPDVPKDKKTTSTTENESATHTQHYPEEPSSPAQNRSSVSMEEKRELTDPHGDSASTDQKSMITAQDRLGGLSTSDQDKARTQAQDQQVSTATKSGSSEAATSTRDESKISARHDQPERSAHAQDKSTSYIQHDEKEPSAPVQEKAPTPIQSQQEPTTTQHGSEEGLRSSRNEPSVSIQHGSQGSSDTKQSVSATFIHADLGSTGQNQRERASPSRDKLVASDAQGRQNAATSNEDKSSTSTENQSTSSPAQQDPQAGRSTYTRVQVRHLLPETLDHYHLPWEHDSRDKTYLLIKEPTSRELQQEMFQHTKRILKDRKEQLSVTNEDQTKESTATLRSGVNRDASTSDQTGSSATTQRNSTLVNTSSTTPPGRDIDSAQDKPHTSHESRELTSAQHDSDKVNLVPPKSTSTQYGSISQENGSGPAGSEPPAGPVAAKQESPSDKPLPVKQILLLCFDRAIEPIAFFSIFPFINQMIVKVGHVPPSDTGFYSGLIESLFSLTQMFVMIIWGRLSDRIGRKPVLVVSLFGIGFATILFGLAQTIWQMILFRCVAGLFAGSIVTIRTMISEHSTSKTQARAFAWFAFFGNLGIFLGPLIGGALAEPNRFISYTFHPIQFFETYPYSLPMFVAGGIAVIAATLTIFFVEETLQPRKRPPGTSDPDSESAPLLSRAENDAEHSSSTLGPPKISDSTGLPKAPGGFDIPDAPNTSSVSETAATAGISKASSSFNVPKIPDTSDLSKASGGTSFTSTSNSSGNSKTSNAPGPSKAPNTSGLPRASDALKSSRKPGDPDSSKPLRGSNPTKAASTFALLENPGTLDLLKAPGVLAVLYIYGHTMVLGFAYTAVAPIFFFEPISLGGFGFSSSFISLFMAITGAAQAIWLLLIFPPLQHRIGTGGVLRLCAYAWPPFFLCLPLLNGLLRIDTLPSTTIFWTLAPIALSVGVGVSMAFTAVQLALNDISPDPRVLGTLNSLALTLTSGLRSIVPAAFGVILAVGVRSQIIWGYLVWVIMIILAVGLVFGLRWLPEAAEGKIYEQMEQEERE